MQDWNATVEAMLKALYMGRKAQQHDEWELHMEFYWPTGWAGGAL